VLTSAFHSTAPRSTAQRVPVLPPALRPKTFTSTLAAAVTSVAFQVKLTTSQMLPWVHVNTLASGTETAVPALTSPPLSHSSIRTVGVPSPQVSFSRTKTRNSWRPAPLVRGCVGVAKLK
jgi:hypothetical protein